MAALDDPKWQSLTSELLKIKDRSKERKQSSLEIIIQMIEKKNI